MATVDYAAEQVNAAAALAEFGQSATLRQVAQVHDENTGAVTTTETDHTGLSAVLLPMGEAAKQFGAGSAAFSDLFDPAIKRERRFCLLSAADLAVTPVGGDRLIVAGKTWEIVGVDPLAPDGSTTILYSVGLQA